MVCVKLKTILADYLGKRTSVKRLGDFHHFQEDLRVCYHRECPLLSCLLLSVPVRLPATSLEGVGLKCTLKVGSQKHPDIGGDPSGMWK